MVVTIKRDEKISDDRQRKLLKYSPMYFNPKEEDIIYLNLNVSEICNYRCLKCFNGSLRPDTGSLDLSGLISIVDRAVDELGIKSIYISGRGETFLVGKGDLTEKLQNYRRFVEHANQKGLGIMQFTNGYYLDKDMVDFLAEKNVSIVVSIDTLDEQKYDRLMVPPKDAFRRVMANIDYARRRFPIEQEGKLFRLGINTAISHENLGEVERLKEFCADDIIFFSNYPMLRGNMKDNEQQMCTSEQEYQAFKEKVKETSSYRALAGMCQNGACGFYYNGITIDINGNVLLSPYDISTGKLFGNIRDYESMADAVNKVRDSVRRFLERFPDAKSCPLRHPKYEEFPDYVG
jgi:MoaA/NifB/PqqE/SkfB family radical SAM enzyme